MPRTPSRESTPAPFRAEGPRVGVVMRTKNRPWFLARALSSVLNQTHHNFLLVAINDGGANGEFEQVLQPYRHLFGARLITISHAESKGMEAASNTGLDALSDVSYFVIHDDDDSWNRDFLRETVTFMESEAGQSFGAVATRVDVIEEVVDHQRIRLVGQYPYGPWREPIDVATLLQANSFPPICLLVRWDALKEVGHFDSEMPVLGDWDFALRLLTRFDIGTIPKTLAYYHLRPPGSGPFGNTIRDEVPVHADQRARFLNRMWRGSVQNSEAIIGTSLIAAQNTRALSDRLDELGRQVSQLSSEVFDRDTAAAVERLETTVRSLETRLRHSEYFVPTSPSGRRRAVTSLTRRFGKRRKGAKSPYAESSPVDVHWYLRAYPDVAESGIDPHEHYARFGIHEGRRPQP